jgi:histidine triad (HIT) family protein
MVQGAIPVAKIFEDDLCICIEDIQPQAKKHLLVIPKEHVASLDEAFHQSSNSGHALLGGLFDRIVTIARQQELLPSGFRTVINTGKDGGQTVFHLHIHVLGGESLAGSFGI